MYANNINDRQVVLRGYKRTDELCKPPMENQDPVLISKMLHNLGKIIYMVEYLYEDSMPINSMLLTDMNISDEELLKQIMDIEPQNNNKLTEIIISSEYPVGVFSENPDIKKSFDMTNEYLKLLVMFKNNQKTQTMMVFDHIN